jgi:hypothetical protein
MNAWDRFDEFFSQRPSYVLLVVFALFALLVVFAMMVVGAVHVLDGLS